MLTRMRGIAVLMSSVFFLMSACLLIQVQASDDVPSCHASTQRENTPGTKFEMGRCCQAGILKSQDNLKTEFHDLHFLPVTTHQAQQTFLNYHPSENILEPGSYRRTGDRLAELSLLRI